MAKLSEILGKRHRCDSIGEHGLRGKIMKEGLLWKRKDLLGRNKK
jgi:hypothetical protein